MMAKGTFVVFYKDSTGQPEVVLKPDVEKVLNMITPGHVIESIYELHSNGVIYQHEPIFKEGKLQLEIVPSIQQG